MDNTKLSQRLTILTDELYVANEYFEGYIALYNKQADHANDLNLIPGFIQLTLEAYLELSALILAKLFDDTGKEVVSLYRIPNWLEQNKDLRSCKEKTLDAIKEINKVFSNNTDNCEHLKLLRDKLLAHTDKKQLTSNIWEQSQLAIKDYRSLLHGAHAIICTCKVLVNEPLPILGMGIDKEVDTLVNILSLYNNPRATATLLTELEKNADPSTAHS